MSRSALTRMLAGGTAAACLLALSGFVFPASSSRLLAQARERVIYASVIDRANDSVVTGLGTEAFVVREDGTQREVLRVVPATSPMAVAVVIDNSQPAAPAISDLRRALTPFLTALDGIGPISLVTIADRPTSLAEYTTSQKALQDAVNRLFHAPSSGATLLDSINDVAKGLAKREEDRTAIVVVTTENIEFTNLHYRDVLESLERSGATLHAIVLSNPARSMNSEEARSRATVLDRGPRESGGFRRDVLTSMAFEPRLRDLAAILKHQYRVTYARPESLIPPEKIEIAATNPSHEAFGTAARGQASK